MKIMWHSFLLLILSYYSAECGIRDGYDFLMKNRDNLVQPLNKDIPDAYIHKNKTVYLKFIIGMLQNKNLSYNDSTAYELCSMFISAIKEISYRISGTDVIIDSTIFVFFSKILNCNPDNKKDVALANYAAQALIDKAGFNELIRYKPIIKTALLNSGIDYAYNASLSVLMGLDSNDNKEYIKKAVRAQYNARLDDSAAIKFLIDEYKNSTRYKDKVNAIKNIMTSGKRDLIEKVLLDFNDPIYDINNYKTAPACTTSSTQFQILLSLARYYPANILFREELYKYAYNDKYRYDITLVKSYISRILAWIKEEYKIAPKSENPPAYIIRRWECPDYIR